MKKIFILTIVFFILFTSSTPFEDRTMEILTSYKWCVSQEYLDKDKMPNEPYITELYYIYDETTCTKYERWSDAPTVLETTTVKYYIGREGTEVKVNREVINGKTVATYEEIKFDNSKVGKNRTGNYILKEYGLDGDASILLIGSMSEKKLVLHSVNPETGGVTSTLEARPKN